MIELTGVHKSYGDTVALNNATFSVGKGELFGLIGPDGAGKSTAMRMLVTLLLADKGSISFDGRDVVEDYQYIRRNVGYMPGRFSLYTDLTVEENLEFFAHVFSSSIRENYHLIKDIYEQLEPFKDRRAGALSGGMKQKLALCCALIHKPLALVLDEPTTGVDAVSRAEFWDMLQRLKEHEITMLVSTPYLEEASLCDRVGLINNGTLMRTDAPNRIVESYSKSLVSVRSSNNNTLLGALRTLPEVAAVYPYRDVVRVSSETPLSNTAIERVGQGAGVDVTGIEEAKPDIEDCFMDYMMNS